MADNTARISHNHTLRSSEEPFSAARDHEPDHSDDGMPPNPNVRKSAWLHSGDDEVVMAAQADHEAWLHLKTEHAKLRHPGDRADHNPSVY